MNQKYFGGEGLKTISRAEASQGQTAGYGSRRMLSWSARAAWVNAVGLAKIIKPIKDLVALQVAEW